MPGTPQKTEPPPAAAAPEGEARPLPALAVSGVVLSKAQLMDALRVYVPGITDLRPDMNGEHFTILFSPQDGGPGQPGQE